MLLYLPVYLVKNHEQFDAIGVEGFWRRSIALGQDPPVTLFVIVFVEVDLFGLPFFLVKVHSPSRQEAHLSRVFL